MNVGSIATEYLDKIMNREEEVDTTFGLYEDEGTLKLGDKEVNCDGNDLIIGRAKYEGTQSLWELIVLKEPSEESYDDDDLDNYSEIMINTNAMRRDNDP